MRDRGRVVAVVGGQYGSEGKGVIVNHLADQFRVHVRVGGPNAGHSFYRKSKVRDNGGVVRPIYVREVMQQLPCGWTNKDATLVIGPGAVVDLRQLQNEAEHVRTTYDGNIWDRIKVSAHAFALEKTHHEEEGGVEGELHRRIGSTGHGVGAARHARMSRDPEHGNTVAMLTKNPLLPIPHSCVVENIPQFLEGEIARGRNVLLEGTQGSGLSLIHGPWPYVTSADTNVAQLLADAGIAPRLLDRTIMVCRTYPIRVAGNSGPMRGEISWEELNRRLGKEGITEQTTVTKKTRRIAEWDEDLVLDAVTLNGPTDIAITFLDYLDPEDEGVEDYNQLSDTSHRFVEYVETLTGVPVTLCGVGGGHWHVISRGFRL